MTTIGLLGGSFNPVHVGHTIVASYVAQHGPVDQVWLVLSPRNPLKQADELASDTDRLAMLRLAAEPFGSNQVEVSDVELSMPRPSYTIDTLRTLSERYPDCRFKWIAGSDSLRQLDRWKDWEEILHRFGMIIYPRPSYEIPAQLPEGVEICDAPGIEISSSFIRNEIKSGRDITYYVTESVKRYIISHNLYSIYDK